MSSILTLDFGHWIPRLLFTAQSDRSSRPCACKSRRRGLCRHHERPETDRPRPKDERRFFGGHGFDRVATRRHDARRARGWLRVARRVRRFCGGESCRLMRSIFFLLELESACFSILAMARVSAMYISALVSVAVRCGRASEEGFHLSACLLDFDDDVSACRRVVKNGLSSGK